MKIKYLIICIILTLVSLSKVFACHKTGDSNCTPISNSLSNSSEATNEKHDNVANYYDNDTHIVCKIKELGERKTAISEKTNPVD